MDFYLIQDFAVVLLIAAISGLVFRRLGMSVVVGYLLAGILVGPYTPPFALVSDLDRIQSLSQLGLVFLMFFVGLGLNLSRIKRLGLGTLICTVVAAVIVLEAGRLAAVLAGWNALQGQFFAAMFMCSSSAIIIKILNETGRSHERFAQKAQGVTLSEDIVAVVMLTLLTSQVHWDAADDGSGAGVGKTLALLGGFVALVFFLGFIFLPKVLRYFTRPSDGDLKVVLVCGLLFASAVAAAAAGFSVALGAFLLGVLTAESPLKSRIESSLSGTLDMFSAIFFVSVGMMLNVGLVAQELPTLTAVVLFALGIRILAVAVAMLLTGTQLRDAVRSALILTPIGEFSFVIAQLGVDSGVTPQYFTVFAVGVSLATALLAPLLLLRSDATAVWVESWLPRRWLQGLGAYQDWLQRAGRQRDHVLWWKLTRDRLAQVLGELALMVGVLGFSSMGYAQSVDWLLQGGWTIPALPWIWGGLTLVFVMILGVAVWRNCSALAMIYAEALTQGSTSRVMCPALRGGIQVLTALILLWLIWLMVPWQVMSRMALWILAVSAVLSLVFLMPRLIRWYSIFQISVRAGVMAGTSSLPEANEKYVAGSFEWQMEVTDCLVTEGSVCAGQALAECNLRSHTGSSIVEIDRQGFVISNPGADFVLYPGDKVLLFGTADSNLKAKLLIGSERESGQRAASSASGDFEQAALHTLHLAPDCSLVGKKLADAGLFKQHGIQVLGIRRGGEKRLNPTGEDIMQSGDDLLLLAVEAQLVEVRRKLVNFD